MVNSCAVCGVTYVKGSPISFHRLPAETGLRQEWILALNLSGRMLAKFTFVCSGHFTESCFVHFPSGKIGLKKGAVPRLHPVPPYMEHKQAKRSTRRKLPQPITQLGIDDSSSTDTAKETAVDYYTESASLIKTAEITGSKREPGPKTTERDPKDPFPTERVECSTVEETAVDSRTESASLIKTAEVTGLKKEPGPSERHPKDPIPTERVECSKTPEEFQRSRPRDVQYAGRPKEDAMPTLELTSEKLLLLATLSNTRLPLAVPETATADTAAPKANVVQGDSNFVTEHPTNNSATLPGTNRCKDAKITIDPTNVCRACLSQGNLTNMCHMEYQGTTLSRLYEALCSVKVTPDDAAPQNICENCVATLVRFYEFRNSCIESERTINSLLGGVKSAARDDPKPDEPQNPESLDKIAIFLEESSDPDDVLKETARVLAGDLEKPAEKKTKQALYPCFCGLNFLERIQFVEHRVKEKHYSLKINSCPQCQRLFMTRKALVEHMRTHSNDRPFICHVCGQGFKVKANMFRHVRRHTKEDAFVCDVCGKELSTKFTLNEHKRIHTGEKPYLCGHCGAQFAFSSVFRLHLMRDHDDDSPHQTAKQKPLPPKKEHKCHVCEQSYPTRHALFKHRAVHRYKKFRCDDCGKEYTFKSGLEAHAKFHKEERPHVCHVCQKGFVRGSSLKKHLFIHSEEKPHWCKTCSRGFTQLAHYKRHLQAHAGARPYPCTMCSKSYTERAYLRAHMNAHLGIRPYECDVCSAGFYDLSTMKKHRKRHDRV